MPSSTSQVPAYAGLGILVRDILFLSPREAFEALSRGATLMDLRQEDEIELRRFRVDNILYLPAYEVRAALTRIPKDRPLILADEIGLESKEVATFLATVGFPLVSVLNGGLAEWHGDGLPTTVDGILTGQCSCKLRPQRFR
jgi:rhodanese-related sulfurtransferase